VIVGHLGRARRASPRTRRFGERDPVRRDLVSWAAHVLREHGMPSADLRTVLARDDPGTIRRYMDLHRERLEERLMDR